MDKTYEIVGKRPGSCSPKEIHDFVMCVAQGGQIAIAGLQERVESAAQLVFLRIDGHLVGTAALKSPNPRYRARVAHASSVALHPDSYPYELGWVFIFPQARRNGHAQSLSEAALSFAGNCGTFATSHTDNLAMHTVLVHVGFVASGTAYPSLYGEHYLQLFTRTPSNDSMSLVKFVGTA